MKRPLATDAGGSASPLSPDRSAARTTRAWFKVSPELLADVLGIPEGYAVAYVQTGADGLLHVAVEGDGVEGRAEGEQVLVFHVEHGRGTFGGTIRRPRFEPAG